MKYRPHIRADFQRVYGVDLHDLWRARQGVRILDLLNMLPRNSAYKQAILNDPDVAKRIVDQEEEADREGKAPPSFEWEISEFSPEVIALQRVERLLDELAVMTAQQVAGKKSKRRASRLPKLVTAIDAERESRQKRVANSIIEQFTPWAA